MPAITFGRMAEEKKVRLTSANALSKDRIKPALSSHIQAKGDGSAKPIRNPKTLIQEVLRPSPLEKKRPDAPAVKLTTAAGNRGLTADTPPKRGKITIVQPPRVTRVQPPRVSVQPHRENRAALRANARSDPEAGSGTMRSALITQPKPRIVITQPKRVTTQVANMFRSPLRLTGARAVADADAPMRRGANFSAGVLRSKRVQLSQNSKVKQPVLKEKLVLRQRWLPPSNEIKLFPRKGSDSESLRSDSAPQEPARQFRWHRRQRRPSTSASEAETPVRGADENEVDHVSASSQPVAQSSHASSNGDPHPFPPAKKRKKRSPSPSQVRSVSPVRKGRRGRQSGRKRKLASSSPEHKSPSSPSVKVVKTTGFSARKRATDDGTKKNRVHKQESTDKATKKEKDKASRKKAEKARLQEKEKARQAKKEEARKLAKERKAERKEKTKERKKSASRRAASLGSEDSEKDKKKEKKTRKRASSVSSSSDSSVDSKSSHKKSKSRKETPKKRHKSKSQGKKRSITIKPGYVGVCVRFSAREAVRAFPKRSRLHEVVTYYKKHWNLEGEYGFWDKDHDARLDSLDSDVKTRENHILLRLTKG